MTEGWLGGGSCPWGHPSPAYRRELPSRGAFYCCANLKAPLCKGGSAEGGGGLWPDGSRSICPQDYNPSVCAAAQPALRARTPLSLRDISPHCGESPFTQGGLLGSRRGEQCSPVAFYGSARLHGASRTPPPTTHRKASLVSLLGSRRGGFHIRPWRFAAAQDPAQFPSLPPKSYFP